MTRAQAASGVRFEEEIVRIADRLDVLVRTGGSGPPLLFLHSSGGVIRDAAFLEQLAARYRVIQPVHPGWPGSEAALEHIDNPVDMALHYGDVIRTLQLPPLPVVGYSIGGMFAAELAAVEPDLVTRLVLIDAVGLWVEDAPMVDFFAYRPEELVPLVWYDPEGEAARRFLTPPDDEADRLTREVANTVSLAAASKFLWATPDRGLGRRLYRIAAPTLLLWGEADGLSPVATAHAFARGIRSAQIVTVQKASHAAIRERPEACLDAVLTFLER